MTSLHSRIDAFAEQARQIAQENASLKVSLESQIDLNLQAMKSIAKLHADKTELLEGLKYCLPHIVGARKIGDSAYKIAEALITKHSGAGDAG